MSRDRTPQGGQLGKALTSSADIGLRWKGTEHSVLPWKATGVLLFHLLEVME